MRRFIFTLLLLLCAVGQQALAADFSKLIILHTNDTHGYALQEQGHIGMESLAAYKESLVKAGYDVILLDAGDCFQGNTLVNLNKGEAAVAYMDAVGYTAGCLGNHEFDYGQKLLRKRMHTSKHPLLSCNVFYTASGKHFAASSTVLKRPSGRIGIVGMTTPTTSTSSMPINTVGLTFKEKQELYQAVQEEINKLQDAHCDLIIGLGHMGSQADCMGNRSDDVIRNVKGLQIFIDGHDHLVKNKYINGVLQAETGYYSHNIGKISFKDGRWVEELVSSYDGQNRKVADVLTKYNKKTAPFLQVKIAKSAQTLDGKAYPGLRNQEMPLGDLVADAFLAAGQKEWQGKGTVAFALDNGGGIRNALPQGNITRKDIYNCLAFNNQLYIASIKGRYLLEALELATAVTPAPSGGYPQVAGLKFTLNTQVPYVQGQLYPGTRCYAPAKPGSRVQLVEVGGKPFDPEETYLFVASNFILTGGSDYVAIKEHAKVEQMLSGEQEVFEKYLQNNLGGVIPKQYYKAAGRELQK